MTMTTDHSPGMDEPHTNSTIAARLLVGSQTGLGERGIGQVEGRMLPRR